MNLLRIYQCLCDETRLRILHLLSHTPLCVCHFGRILDVPQVKVSKHLLYLKSHGLVESRQHRNWRMYMLPARQSYELERHLQCLQDCIQENRLFRKDMQRLKAVLTEAAPILDECRAPAGARISCCKD